jgi:hypothetical protein
MARQPSSKTAGRTLTSAGAWSAPDVDGEDIRTLDGTITSERNIFGGQDCR